MPHHELMATAALAAANLDSLSGYEFIHIMSINDDEVRLLCGETALKITEESEGLIITAWPTGTRPSSGSNNELHTRLLAAETIWATDQPPTLKGIISPQCLTETTSLTHEDHRISERLARLFQTAWVHHPPQTPDSLSPEEERHAHNLATWTALWDLIADLADQAGLNSKHKDLTAQFPGVILTSVETDYDTHSLTGIWREYWWHFTISTGLAQIVVGTDEQGRLWNAAQPIPAAPGDKPRVPSNLAPQIESLLSALTPSPTRYRFRILGDPTENHAAVAYGYTEQEAYANLTATTGIPPQLIPQCFDPIALPITEPPRPLTPLPPEFMKHGTPGTPTIRLQPQRRDTFLYSAV